MVGAVSAAVPYVGRSRHRAAVAQAFREPGHVVVIRGEAGVGKTALVATERAAAITDVIEGACLQLAGQPLPLAALEQIFDARGGWPAGSAEPQAPEQRLRAVRQWAEALVPSGGTTSTTLVVEDLHWADETTCDFLVYVASTAGRRQLSLVVTLRDDETPRVGRVQQLAAELSRLPGAVDVELGRLDRADAAELVALLTGGGPSADIDAWYEQSQGNPYLLGELVKDPGARRVKDVLLSRVRALGPQSAELIGLAAIFGLWVSDAHLYRASALAPVAYAAAVREAIDAGVLVVDGADYSFRHSLMCEAVLSQLLPIERRMLHERAARTLGTGPADDVVTAASVSLHWSGAGVPDRAAEWSLRAARKARQRNAFAEAWGYYRRALDPVADLGGSSDGLQLILEAAGTARLAGDPAAAAALLEGGLSNSAAAGAERACALERLGCFRWEAGLTAQSVAAYTEAAAALDEQVSAVHAQVWGAQARAAFIMAEFDVAIALSDRAVGAAREHGSDAVLADALTTRGAAGAFLGDADAVEVLREGVALARTVEDPGVLCRSYANLILAYEYTGLPDDACTAAIEGLRLLPEYGLELAVGAALACNATNMLRRRGRYAECEEVLAGLLDGRSTQGQGLHLHLERAELQLAMGDTVAARASLAAAASLTQVDEPAVVAAVATATAELFAQEGDAQQCYRTVDEALHRLADTQDTFFRTELIVIGLRNEADRSGPLPDPAAAARIDRLAAELDHLEPAEDSVTSAAEKCAARTELGRARRTATAADWAASAALWTAIQRPREVAYAQFRQAECHAAAKQRDKAAAAAGAARALAERLGARPVLVEIEALIARTRLSPAPAPRTPADSHPYGLTEREFEILALLGTGATNRQIARKLFISDRTVGVHVSHVLHKLQVTNRAQAAALAARVAR